MNKAEHYLNGTAVDFFPWPEGIPDIGNIQKVWRELELFFPDVIDVSIARLNNETRNTAQNSPILLQDQYT